MKNLKHKNEANVHEINFKLFTRLESPPIVHDILIINNSLSFDFTVLRYSVDDH